MSMPPSDQVLPGPTRRRLVQVMGGGACCAATQSQLSAQAQLRKDRLIRIFRGHSDEVMCVAFSPDGRAALSGSADKTLKLWEVATGKNLRTFEGQVDWIFSVAFSPDGRTALSAGKDKTSVLWELTTGKALRTVAVPFQAATTIRSSCGTWRRAANSASSKGTTGRSIQLRFRPMAEPRSPVAMTSWLSCGR
jgi:WD40 repeat protein